jgi:hypothetical protein
MRTPVILSSVLLLMLCACTREQPSRIVKLAEQAGAGPLTDVSVVDMRVWLNGHPQVAVRVDALCAPQRTNPTAAWPETTEGRLCAAARVAASQIEAQRHQRRSPDTAGFLPGWK